MSQKINSIRLTDEQRKHNFKLWVTFFRKHLDIFCMEYLECPLYPYQQLMMREINRNEQTVVIAARATAKTYITALAAVALCILYPNLKVLVVSPYKSQSITLMEEKIRGELYNLKPKIKQEIKQISTGGDKQEVIFYNGSRIFAVPCSDRARSPRANVAIYEEAADLDKQILETAVQPTLAFRRPSFSSIKKYENHVSKYEGNKEI